jgi:hypothetical protein
MTFRLRLQLMCVTLLLSSAFSYALAAPSSDRTQWGSNITIGAGEETGELTCFGCSIRIRGHVTSDVTVFGGSLIMEDGAVVDGDAAVFAGGMRLEKSVRIGGDAAVFGGRIHRDPGANIGGETSIFSGPVWILLIFVLPLFVVAGFVWFVIWLIRRLMRPAVPATA